ncbi:MAG: translocation/assembly module TamB domain-containing protein, partial [Saprospiraceae bacterium]|nr:translocation/assembly module TamB domain-containing protein [Saprospiraceae bacterium]
MSSAAENPTDPSNYEPNSEQNERQGWRSLLMWFQRILLTIFGLFILSYLIIHIPVIQNWTVKRVTNSLSERLDTKVVIDYFRMDFLNKVSLRGVYIEDLNHDTLLVADRLSASLNLNPVAIIKKGLVISQLDLSDAQLFLRRAPDAKEDNLKSMLRLLINPEKKKKKGGFSLGLSRLNLDQIAFYSFDQYKGQRMKIKLKEGLLQIQTLDIPNAFIYADYVRLTEPQIAIDDYPRSPYFPDTIIQKKRDSTRLSLTIGELDFRKGVFDLHNYRKEPLKLTEDDKLNYRHLEVYDIDMRVQRFSFEEDVFSGNIKKMAAKEKSGFTLNNFSVSDAMVGRQGFQLNGLQIQTPETRIGDTLIFRYDGYRSFRDFENSVIMEGRFNNANVRLEDIMTFAPGLYNNAFFRSNANKKLVLDGILRGTVNNLSGRNLNIRLGDKTALKGRFSSRNLAVKNNESMNLRLDDLRTNMRTLRDVVPNLSLPANFDRLGSLRFNGSFDGFFADFVANGYLRTDIGEAEMDMQMNLFEGKEKVRYRGEMDLRNFDLGIWTGNTDLGKVTFTSRVLNGFGIAGKNVRADLAAKVSNFEFKEYQYKNASIAGQLEARQFDGNFVIRDENIDFSFAGQLEFGEDVPYYNFEAFINRLDLQALNFTEEAIVLSGDVDLNLKNQKIADLSGSAEVRNFTLETTDTSYAISFIDLNSWVDSSAVKHLTLQSDVAGGSMQGQFRLDRIPTTLFQYVNQNFPEFSRELRIPLKDTIASGAFFDFDIQIEDTKGLTKLLDPKLGEFKNVSLSGILDDRQQQFDVKISVPALDYDNIHAESIFMVLDSDHSEGELDFSVEKLILNNKTYFAPITLISFLDRDTLLFSLNYDDEDQTAFLGNLEVDGRLTVRDTNILDLHFDDSKLVFLETPWQIDEDNVITFLKDSVTITDFTTRSQDKVVAFNSFGQRGVNISADNLDMAEINELIQFKPLDFGGKIDVAIRSDDIFKASDLKVVCLSDTLWINGDDWGQLRLDASAPTPKAPLYTYFTLTKDTAQLILEGFYNLGELGNEPIQEKQYFDANLDINGYPLTIAEYFIGNTISDTYGTFDAGLRFYGTPSDPNVFGALAMSAGGLKVNFLKTDYAWEESEIAVNNYLFDLTGTQLVDKYGHIALVNGGIRHDQLKDFGFNARLTTNRFLALDTEKGDNKLFYGHALGDGEVLFTGSFKQPDVYVRAKVADSTRIVIPVSQERTASELSFLRFVDRDAPVEDDLNSGFSDRLPDLKGVSLEMELEVNPEAELQIIFNEQAGDIIQGKG